MEKNTQKKSHGKKITRKKNTRKKNHTGKKTHGKGTHGCCSKCLLAPPSQTWPEAQPSLRFRPMSAAGLLRRQSGYCPTLPPPPSAAPIPKRGICRFPRPPSGGDHPICGGVCVPSSLFSGFYSCSLLKSKSVLLKSPQMRPPKKTPPPWRFPGVLFRGGYAPKTKYLKKSKKPQRPKQDQPRRVDMIKCNWALHFPCEGAASLSQPQP